MAQGHAVAFYGRPRATKDFDVWVESSPDNARRVMAALRSFGAPLAGLSEADLAHPGTGFRMGAPPFRIEILTEISGIDFRDAWHRRELCKVDDVPVSIIAFEDLIANKRAAGRKQDLADVEALERQRPNGRRGS